MSSTCVWKKASFYYDVVERPFATARSPISTTVQWPNPYIPGRLVGVREEARGLFEETDYAVVADIMCLGPFEGACMLRGYEQFSWTSPGTWTAPRPPGQGHRDGHRALGRLPGTSASTCRWSPRAMTSGIQRARTSPRRCTAARQAVPQAPLRLHPLADRCQGVHALLWIRLRPHPDLIEVGVEILNPIQRSAAKMDIAAMKRRVRHASCASGAAASTCSRCCPSPAHERIRDEVAYSIDTLGKDGGYVFCPAHNIQPDVSPDRIDVMYRQALDQRG